MCLRHSICPLGTQSPGKPREDVESQRTWVKPENDTLIYSDPAVIIMQFCVSSQSGEDREKGMKGQWTARGGRRLTGEVGATGLWI